MNEVENNQRTRKHISKSIIDYIINRKMAISVLSTYIHLKESIKRAANSEIEPSLKSNVAGLYLSLKIEGMHPDIHKFITSIKRYISEKRDISEKIENIEEAISVEEILKMEILIIEESKFNFMYKCLFKQLLGALILRGQADEFKKYQDIVIKKMREGSFEVSEYGLFLRSL